MVDSYKKEYLPGYTGHVPKKNDIFGCTAGDINKILTGKVYKPSNYDVEMTLNRPPLASRTFYSKPPETEEQTQALQFGNTSKQGPNWIGGPTDNVKAQHVPGYQGYVPNIKSENLYGKSYAKVTGQAINNEFIKGVALPARDRFMTQTGFEFNKQNHRRIREAPEPAEIKD